MKKYFFYNFFKILPKFWIKDFIKIILFTLANGVFELLSIGLIIPLLSVFANKPDFLRNNVVYFSKFSDEKYLLILLIIFILLFFFKNFFILLSNKKKLFFSHDLYVYLTNKLYLKYLNKKYVYYLNKNTSDLTRTLISEIPIFCFSVVITIINLISLSITFLLIVTFLLIYNLSISLSVIIIMSILGFLIVYFQQQKLKLYGKIRQVHQESFFKLINESIGNIKEIILSNTQKFFFEKFSFHVCQNAKAGKKKDFFFILSRPILELITLSILFFSVYIMIKINYKIEDILIILGVFALGIIRLIPVANGLIQSLQSIKYNKVVINLLSSELFNDQFEENTTKKENLKIKKLEFNVVKFHNCSFRYNEDKYVFKNINLKIRKGEKIGIIGKSGSGKSTLINILSGLLAPSSGHVYIDNENLFKNLYRWQMNIGYVSQNTFLADDTLLFNIALFALDKPIDIERCKNLLKIMHLDKLMLSKSEKLNFKVGERGIKLSGGQIQRLGIARALYKKPEILILDEATSSVDPFTQNKILANVNMEMEKKTVISISHDIASLKNYKKIFLFNNNKFEILKNIK